MLTDDQPNPAKWPTRANMVMAMQQLVAGAQPGDSLFFHYSGKSCLSGWELLRY